MRSSVMSERRLRRRMEASTARGGVALDARAASAARRQPRSPSTMRRSIHGRSSVGRAGAAPTPLRHRAARGAARERREAAASPIMPARARSPPAAASPRRLRDEATQPRRRCRSRAGERCRSPADALTTGAGRRPLPDAAAGIDGAREVHALGHVADVRELRLIGRMPGGRSRWSSPRARCRCACG